MYDIHNGKLVAQFEGHLNLIYDLNWSADDSELISASSDTTAKIWNTNFSKKKRAVVIDSYTNLQHWSYVYCAAFHPTMKNPRLVVTGSYDHKVRIWDRETTNLLMELNNHQSRVNSVIFNKVFSRNKGKLIFIEWNKIIHC